MGVKLTPEFIKGPERRGRGREGEGKGKGEGERLDKMFIRGYKNRQ